MLSCDPCARSSFVTLLLSVSLTLSGPSLGVLIRPMPNKIRKEGLATIFAEWKNDNAEAEPIVIKVTPEIVLKNFKRISDDDVSFMGLARFTLDQIGWFVKY